MAYEYFSERQGLRNPTQEEVGQRFWNGFRELIMSLMEQGFLIERFPLECEEGQGFIGTDEERLKIKVFADLGIVWPLDTTVLVTPKTMDLIEFIGQYVSKPGSKIPHSYWRHYHFSDFNKEEGFQHFANQINVLLRRCGHPYELKEHGKIEHLGPDVLAEQLRSVMFKTGDSELDALLEDARERFLSPDPKIRRDSIEKLWDAWERLKTLEIQNDKKTSVKQLLTKAILNVPLREKIESECQELTEIGNQFRIRHHEMGKVEIQSDLDVDYLFYRLFGLIFRLLKGTERIN